MPAISSDSPEDRFSRLRAFYGEAGFARLRAARVAVVGLGGVGSHTAVALARSGVGALLLADPDVVTPSSLNRLVMAGPADVGTPKVELLRRHLAATCPDTATTLFAGCVDGRSAPGLLAPAPDFLADASDALGPKAELLAFCAGAGIPAASAMGASARRDPTRLRIAALAATSGCPVARMLRRLLARKGVKGGIACVFSPEPAPALPPEARSRSPKRLPSQVALPGIFGYALAAYVLECLAGRRAHPPPEGALVRRERPRYPPPP